MIGCGVAGTNAIKMAMGMGADVTAIDLSTKRLAELDDLFDNRITTLFSNVDNLEKAVVDSDLVIGAVLAILIYIPSFWVQRVMARHSDDLPGMPGTGVGVSPVTLALRRSGRA